MFCSLGGFRFLTQDRITNSLKHLSKAVLCEDVANFCVRYGFQDHTRLFQQAALIAQDPDGFEQMEELTEEDRYHLRREITREYQFGLSFSRGKFAQQSVSLLSYR